MNIYSNEYTNVFSIENYYELVEEAKTIIINSNNQYEIIFEHSGTVANHVHEDKQGVLDTYRILCEGKLLGHLITFRCLELNYLFINSIPNSN